MKDIYNCQYILGVDCGGLGSDLTALSLGRIDGSNIMIEECIAMDANVRFHDKYAAIAKFAQQFPDTTVVIDATGLGAPVCEAVREEFANTVGITITAGAEANQKNKLNWTVPKAVLVGSLQQTLGRSLKVSKACQLYDKLKAEAQNFSYKANIRSMTDSYEARVGHDDLIMSVSYVSWFFLESQRRVMLYKPFTPGFDGCERVSPWTIR